MSTEDLQSIVRLVDDKVRLESPSNLVLQRQSKLGYFLFQLSAVSLVVTLASVFVACDSNLDKGPPTSLLFGFGFAALTVLFFGCYLTFRDELVLDLQLRELHLHRHWGGFQQSKLIRDFGECHGVVLKPTRHSYKGRVRWEYALCLVDRKGWQIVVVDRFDSYPKISELGEALSSALEIPYFSGESETLMKIKRGLNGPEILFAPYKEPAIQPVHWWVAALAASWLVLALLAR